MSLSVAGNEADETTLMSSFAGPDQPTLGQVIFTFVPTQQNFGQMALSAFCFYDWTKLSHTQTEKMLALPCPGAYADE